MSATTAPLRPRATVRVATLPGVFRPRSDALLLVAAMRERGLARGAGALDLFTGSGVLAVAAALEGAREVTAVDLSRRAVLTARPERPAQRRRRARADAARRPVRPARDRRAST